MLDAFLNFLKAAIGMLVVLGAWAVWQTLVRRRSGRGPLEDVNEHMTHGCAGCTGSGACHNPARFDHDQEVCSRERE